MTDKIWQCCFTNTDHINGNAVKSGWTGLAVSESIPSAAYEACTRWQSANSRIENESAALDNTVYELICDKDYAMAMKHKYGIKDNHGRPNMFSHAYIVPIEEFLKDPNCLLALSDKNFVDDQEEAERRNNDPANLSNLIYDKSFDISYALELLSMNREVYKTLLRTVYILNVDEKSLRSLHIEVYDDNLKNKALMYLIHIGLPYHTRENLNIAISPQTDPYFRSVLFDKEAKDRGIFIVPESGENNNRAQASPVFELIDEFADHYDLDEKDFYYKDLNDKAIGLGGKGVLTERALKIAYAMNNIGDVKEKSEWTDDKLMLRLSDAFLYNADMISAVEYRKEFEDFVAAMLDEVMKRRLPINENMYSRITGFSINATSEALKETWKNCRQYQFENAMSDEQKREWLTSLDNNALESFIAFAVELINQNRDHKSLKDYLIGTVKKCKSIDELLRSEAKTLRIEKEVSDKALRYEIFQDIHKVLIDKLWELYNASINSVDIKTLYSQALKVYELIAAMDEGVKMETAKKTARSYFWQAFTFEKIEKFETDSEIYSLMSFPEDENYRFYANFIDILNKTPQTNDIYKILNELNIYYVENAETFIKKGYKEKKLIANIFIKVLKKNMENITDYADGFIEDMVTIAIETDDHSIYEEFIYIMNKINGFEDMNYKILDILSQHIEESALRENSILRKAMFVRIHEKFKDIEIDEEEEYTIKLDSWLALGKIRYADPDEEWFKVFDDNDYKAAVLLDKNIEGLMEGSYYFVNCENDIEKDRCLNAARYYVEDKGQHRSVIHKWVKYMERRDREPSGGIGDFFTKFFGNKKEE